VRSSENTTNLLKNLVKEKEEEIKRLKEGGAVSQHHGELQEGKEVMKGGAMACQKC
jgi:hypothetical protein